MKKLILLLNILIINLAFISSSAAEDKERDEIQRANDIFRHLMEVAHPTPDLEKNKMPYVPLSEPAASSSLFINVNLIEPETQQYQMQNESSIAVNPKNPRNLIASAVDYRDTSATHIYVSSNGGYTWKNYNLGRPYKGWTSSNDPSVAFANDGTGYFVYGGFGIRPDTGVLVAENGVFFAKTTDEGKTWKAHIPVIVHTGKQTLDSLFEDKYYITPDNSQSSPYFGHLYIPWKRVTPRDSATQIVIAKSTDKGDSWSVPVNVSKRFSGSSEDTTFGQSFPLCATGPNGEVYVIWNNGIEHAVGFSKSLDGGKTFSEPKMIERYKIFGKTNKLDEGYRHTVKEKVRAESYPIIQVDNTNGSRRGNLYLCWTADNPPNVYFSSSSDGGSNWSSPVFVHSDTTNDQFWAWLSIDPLNGDLAVLYLDSRNDPKNILVEAYVSYSSDGGKTWIDRRAADVAGDLRNNPFQGNAFAGDYSGCAFHNGIIYPSWIDMRSAATNIFDSDVYTAIVNTRAPMPVDNFKVNIIADRSNILQLTWNKPVKKAFGQQLDEKDFHYALFREGKFITEIKSSIESFTDTGLVAHKLYNYSIYAIAETSDSSGIAKASGYAGGARNPAAPAILSSVSTEPNKVTLNIKISSKREDNETPLSNLKNVCIYRDSVLVKTMSVNTLDTGKTIKINDDVSERGFYRYQVTVKDNESPANESQKSNEIVVFTGIIENTLKEYFDGGVLPKYYNLNGWGRTNQFAFSSPNSLTESPAGNYKNKMTYIFGLFPVKQTTELGSMSISFRNAAIIDGSDTGFVEISRNGGTDWEAIAKYNVKNYLPWDDKKLDASDWKPEELQFPLKQGDTAYIRFRLTTSTLISADGWYIDNIDIHESATGVSDETTANNIQVYPNPANDKLILNLKNYNESLKIHIYNIIGSECPVNILNYDQSNVIIDVSSLREGVYYLNIRDNDKINQMKFIIIR